MSRILLLKAAIRGGAAADLFNATVMVGGHVRPSSGTFVAPHVAHRRKRLPEAAPDLFTPRAAPRQAAPDAPPPAPVPAPPAAPEPDPVTQDDSERQAAWRGHRANQRYVAALIRDARQTPNPPPAAEAFDPFELEKESLNPPPATGEPPTHEVAALMRTADDLRAASKGQAKADARSALLDRVTRLAERSWGRAGLGHLPPAYRGARLALHRGHQEADAELAEVARSALQVLDHEARGRGLDPRALARSADQDLVASGQIAAVPEEAAPTGRPEPYRPKEWGMPPGVKASERTRANKAAEAVLRAKPDADMTDADLDVLARYTGWGGCGDSPNEYYTPPDVARAMWNLCRTLGFRGGDVLEPSAGSGVFQQTAPDNATIAAVELSPSSARINRLLHRRSGDEVHEGTLESFAGWDQRKFDLVIGNPPFGSRDAFRYDDLAAGKSGIGRAEHYFLDTALDKAKDGGLVAFIVPSGVMDNATGRDDRIRLQAKGQLMAAFRLPSSAFQDSHTAVTTDILVFRKRPQPIASALSALTPMQQALLPHWDEGFVSGRHMTEGPGRQNIMGTLEPGWRAKAGIGDDITVTGSMAGVAHHISIWRPDAELADNSPTLPAILDAAGDRRSKAEAASTKEPYPKLREGDTQVVDGILYVLRDSRWHRAEEAEPEVVADARRVGAALEKVLSGTQDQPELARIRAIEALDEFTAKHGNPSKLRALLDWTNQPQLPTGGADPMQHADMVARESRRVTALLGAVRPDGSYSDAVTGASTGPARGSVETQATALAAQKGAFTVADLARTIGSDDHAVIADLLFAHPGFAKLPGGGQWTSMDQYLSGELWPKHDAALAAAADADLPQAERERMRGQADALLKAIAPMDLGDVGNIALDSPFVTLDCIAAWKKASSPHGRDWAVTEDRGVYSVHTENTYGYGAARDDLLERMLMRRGVKKDEAALVEEKNQAFHDWLLSDPEWRQKIERQYNRTFRGFAPRTYSDDPIEVPGLSPDFGVHGYQWRGVRWAMEQGKGIIAADVGVGKTPRALILNQLLRSTGRAKKPLTVMPKALLSNWYDMVQQMFPGARVLTIGETITTNPDGTRRSKEDDEATRRRKLAQLAQDDHDFVFMTLPAWNMLNLEEERRERYESDDFFTQRAEALENKKTSKKKQKVADKWDGQKARERFVNAGETIITLESTGVDAVILDEGHSLKNLATPANTEFRDLKFLGAPNEPSKQAASSYQKFRYIREQNGGKNVFLLTATPTKNSPLEIYSMMQHVAPETWTDIGVRNADDFIARFVETESSIILGPAGTAVEANTVAGFRNLDEVRQIARRYIDRTTAAEVGLTLPKPEVIEHQVTPDAAQMAAYDELRPLLAEALKDRKAEGADHPFSIISRMQKAASDMRLYDPAGDHPASPKYREIAANAAKLRADGGQLIFCDYVEGHGLLRDMLVAQGVDPKRIGIINAAATPTSGARQRMGERFNAGELDILIGNTPTMGEGLNLQKRTSDIHHADIPWEPASMTQRNGRGLRQGNKNKAIRLHSYLTGGTFDGYRWQSMMAKGDWQTAFWGGGNTAENMARGSLGRVEMLIFSAANQNEAREKFGAELDAARDRMQASAQADAFRTWGRYRDAKRQLDAMTIKAKAAGRPDAGPAGQQIANRLEAFRATLRASKDFPWKDALDQRDVAIDPKTGRVWRIGDEVEVAPGARFRTYSPEPEPFIVTGLDEASGKVALRHAGAGKKVGHVFAPMADLREGVTPTKVDREAAAVRLKAREAARAKAASDARAEKERQDRETAGRAAMGKVEAMLSGDGYVAPADLAVMRADFLAQHEKALTARITEGALAGKLPGYQSRYVVAKPDGSIGTVASYEVGTLGPDETLALPTPAIRERLLDMAAQEAVESTIEDYHPPTGRRGNRFGSSQGGYLGAKRRPATNPYGDSNHMTALRSLFPRPAADTELAAEVARRADPMAAARVRQATTWHQALSAASGGFHDIAPYPSHLAGNHLQPETAAALMEAAERLGVADKTWNEVPMPGYSSWKQATNQSPDAVRRVLVGSNSYTLNRPIRERLASIPKAAPAALEAA